MSPEQKARRLVIIADEVDGARKIVDAFTIRPGERDPLDRLLATIGGRLRVVAADVASPTQDDAR